MQPLVSVHAFGYQEPTGTWGYYLLLTFYDGIKLTLPGRGGYPKDQVEAACTEATAVMVDGLNLILDKYKQRMDEKSQLYMH